MKYAGNHKQTARIASPDANALVFFMPINIREMDIRRCLEQEMDQPEGPRFF